MAYKRTNWKSGAEGGTLITDERLNNIEDGIQQALAGIPPLVIPTTDVVMTAVAADPTSQFAIQQNATFVGSAEFVEKDDDPGVFDAAKSGLIPTTDEGIFQPTYIRPGSPEIDMSGKLSSLDAGALGIPVMTNHGVSTSYPRPDWSGPVIWVGSVLPANRKPGDLYLAVSVV